MNENSAPNTGAPQNTSYYSENIGLKIGSLEAEVQNLKETCQNLDKRISPLENWKSELMGAWKTAKWLGSIIWIGLSVGVPLLMKHLGWL